MVQMILARCLPGPVYLQINLYHPTQMNKQQKLQMLELIPLIYP